MKDRLRQDLTAAMRAKDEVSKATLRSVLTAISKAETSGKKQAELSDEQVIGAIRSELKKRNEAAAIYAKAGRAELAAREQAEAKVLEPYLPEEIDDDTLRQMVDEELTRITGQGVTGLKAMGPAIKAVRDRAGAQADGARVAAAVKAALTESN